MKTNSLPSTWQSITAVWSRNFLHFRKSWMISFVWIVVEPIFVLGAMGFGLGSYVHSVGGMSYLEFFFPALLCNSVMMVAFFESTYANFTKLSYSKIYHSILIAPVTPFSILWGEVLWSASKAMMSAIGVILVAGPLGAVASWTILYSLPVLFLNGILFSLVGMLVTSKVHNYDQIIYPSSGLIIPISLFSGTYFPLSGLPQFAEYAAYLSPLTHVVQATRALQQRDYSYSIVWNVGVVALAIFLLSRAVERQFTKRILN